MPSWTSHIGGHKALCKQPDMGRLGRCRPRRVGGLPNRAGESEADGSEVRVAGDDEPPLPRRRNRRAATARPGARAAPAGASARAAGGAAVVLERLADLRLRLAAPSNVEGQVAGRYTSEDLAARGESPRCIRAAMHPA